MRKEKNLVLLFLLNLLISLESAGIYYQGIFETKPERENFNHMSIYSLETFESTQQQVHVDCLFILGVAT